MSYWHILRFIHGEKSDLKTLLWVYALTLFFTAFCIDTSHPISLLSLQTLLSLDLIGGIFFNLTDSSKVFWQSRTRMLRVFFLIGHLVQPIVMWQFFSIDVTLSLALYVFMLTAAIFLEFCRGQWNRIGSVASCVFGILFFQHLGFPAEHNWFLFSYLAKLLISFSIKTNAV